MVAGRTAALLKNAQLVAAVVLAAIGLVRTDVAQQQRQPEAMDVAAVKAGGQKRLEPGTTE